LLTILKEYLLSSHYLNLKPFTDYLLPPEIQLFKANKEIVLEGVEVEFAWVVENAVSVRIEPEIGNVSTNGKHTFKPQSQTYKLIAQGHLEISEKLLDLKLFPTPFIESLQIPFPTFQSKTNITVNIPAFQEQSIPKINTAKQSVFRSKISLGSLKQIELNQKINLNIEISEITFLKRAKNLYRILKNEYKKAYEKK
jgi:hypothetical protein